MNISSQPRPVTVTIPWGPGAKVPPDLIDEELMIRDTISHHTDYATRHLALAGNDNNGWSRDKDPSPERVLHSKSANGITYVAAVTTENPQDPPREQIPSEWSLNTSDGSMSQHIVWEQGELVSLQLSHVSDHKSVEDTFRVNDNGTLTWTQCLTSR